MRVWVRVGVGVAEIHVPIGNHSDTNPSIHPHPNEVEKIFKFEFSSSTCMTGPVPTLIYICIYFIEILNFFFIHFQDELAN